jgi:hypothetical protein
MSWVLFTRRHIRATRELLIAIVRRAIARSVIKSPSRAA